MFHWSPANRIAPLSLVNNVADGRLLRVGDYLPDIAVDRDSGDVYVTWSDSLGGSTNKVVLSRSEDGGKTWSSPAVVSHHPATNSFNHAVAVANDGELAVLYYDTARNVDGTADGIPSTASGESTAPNTAMTARKALATMNSRAVIHARWPVTRVTT